MTDAQQKHWYIPVKWDTLLNGVFWNTKKGSTKLGINKKTAHEQTPWKRIIGENKNRNRKLYGGNR